MKMFKFLLILFPLQDDEEDVYELTRNETRSLPRGSSSHSRVIRSLGKRYPWAKPFLNDKEA